jgi:hypothetical protein
MTSLPTPDVPPHVPPRLASHQSVQLESVQLESVQLESAVLGLLLELEASLKTSQRALLTRDLASIEQGTREQTRLVGSLSIVSAPIAAQLAAHLAGDPHQIATALSNPAHRSRVRLDSRLSAQVSSQVNAASIRILYLGRVQAALLVRARQCLRMLAHLVAGPQAGYGPPHGDVRPANSPIGGNR